MRTAFLKTPSYITEFEEALEIIAKTMEVEVFKKKESNHDFVKEMVESLMMFLKAFPFASISISGLIPHFVIYYEYFYEKIVEDTKFNILLIFNIFLEENYLKFLNLYDVINSFYQKNLDKEILNDNEFLIKNILGCEENEIEGLEEKIQKLLKESKNKLNVKNIFTEFESFLDSLFDMKIDKKIGVSVDLKFKNKFIFDYSKRFKLRADIENWIDCNYFNNNEINSSLTKLLNKIYSINSTLDHDEKVL
jgi:hypothetical protein